jgi:hypothetical protein
VYCCHACNEFKGDHWQHASPHRILHPLHDDLSASIVEEADGMLRGLTETGTYHIQRLHLNRPQLIAWRDGSIRRSAAPSLPANRRRPPTCNALLSWNRHYRPLCNVWHRCGGAEPEPAVAAPGQARRSPRA